MAIEQPWFLTRIVAETDSSSQFPFPEKVVRTPSDRAVYPPHEGGFPRKKTVQIKIGFLPR
jgi:hypothetical protein